MNNKFYMHIRQIYMANQKYLTQNTDYGKVYVEFDGITQHASNTDSIASTLFPNSPGPCISYTIGFWHRGTDAAESASIPHYAALTCTGEAYTALAYAYYRPIGLPSECRLLVNRLRTTPSLVFSSRTYYKTDWPSGTFSSASEWRFSAIVVTATSNIIWERGAFRANSTPTSYADYNNALGKYFSLNGLLTSAGAFTAGTAMNLQYRSPSIHLGALTESQLLNIEAEGPSGNLSTAAGWWPGDGDLYPTLTNRGTAGNSWDLTLKNGSQSMIKGI